MRRPLAEHCERLSVTDLRPLVEPGAERHTLADGTPLELRWAVVRGCFGGREGRALVLRCPGCRAYARVLWRPHGADWSCWRCQPISHRSHRRSGSRAGRRKPASWHVDRIREEQQRIAELLALEHFPPRPLVWGLPELEAVPRLPGARLCPERDRALLLRLDALETLRVAVVLPGIAQQLDGWEEEPPDLSALPRLRSRAEQMERATRWAMRRGAHDARTLRRWNRPPEPESKPPRFMSRTAPQSGPPPIAALRPWPPPVA